MKNLQSETTGPLRGHNTDAQSTNRHWSTHAFWLRLFRWVGAASLVWAVVAMPAYARNTGLSLGPDELVSQIASKILEAVRADPDLRAGNAAKLSTLVDTEVLPYVDFQRMTASAIGHHWRQASPEQRERLQTEFKSLLLHVYSGALAQVTDQTIEVKRNRSTPGATRVVVRTVVRGRESDPIPLNYRLASKNGEWKIYDISVLGVWLGQNYRSSFAQEIRAKGIDGLIAKLAEQRAGR